MTSNEKAIDAVNMRRLEITNPAEYLKIRNDRFIKEMPAKYHWMVTGKNPANV